MAQSKSTRPQTKTMQAHVACQWLAGIVDSYFTGEMDKATFDARMAAAHDDIDARGLRDEVSDCWRLRAYGSK